MLSEEENKAITYLKFYIERDVMYENTHYEQIKTILNLVKRQQKEIEELKEIIKVCDQDLELLNGFLVKEKQKNKKILGGK